MGCYVLFIAHIWPIFLVSKDAMEKWKAKVPLMKNEGDVSALNPFLCSPESYASL